MPKAEGRHATLTSEERSDECVACKGRSPAQCKGRLQSCAVSGDERKGFLGFTLSLHGMVALPSETGGSTYGACAIWYGVLVWRNA